MNVYDVALDFVLLDAFSDLQHPPSTVLAVLQNTWITDGMKKSVCVGSLPSHCDVIPPSLPLSTALPSFPLPLSLCEALSAAVWSLLKAKRSMLSVSL